MSLPFLCQRPLAPETGDGENFQQTGETDFSLFRTCRPRLAGFKQNKSHPAHHRLRNDPVTSWLTSLADARTLGRQMGIFGYSHAWRVIILAWAMAWFGPAADLTAGTLDSSGALELTGRSREPFGLLASTLFAGGVRDKWRAAERKVAAERGQQ